MTRAWPELPDYDSWHKSSWEIYPLADCQGYESCTNQLINQSMSSKLLNNDKLKK